MAKSPPPPLPENTPVERIVNGRRFVCHQIQHSGKQGVAIVFDRRQHSDMRKLYHKLNQILSSNGIKKITNSLQILNRARDEILRLDNLDQNYTKTRRELMLRRQELFKEFSSKLGHLESKEAKKAAVVKLKEGLKKKESKIIGNPKSVGHVDEMILVKTDMQSKLNPNDSEIQNPREELQVRILARKFKLSCQIAEWKVSLKILFIEFWRKISDFYFCFLPFVFIEKRKV